MNNLPDLVLRIIFDCLDIKELMKQRLVCKKWNHYILRSKIYELVVNNSLMNVYYPIEYNYGTVNTWFATDKLNNYNSFIFDKLDSSLAKFSSFNLSFLKRLKIKYVTEYDRFRLSDLERLCPRLEQLEIYFGILKPDDRIKLDNLKYLYLDISGSRLLEIDCPKLEALYCNNVTYVNDFKYADRIVHLSVPHFQKEFKKFKNLKIFQWYSSSFLDPNILSIFKKLEELHCHCSLSRKYLFSNGAFENLTKTLRHLMEERKVLNRPHIKIYLFGILLEKNFKEADFNQDLTVLHMKNYDQLENKLPWVSELDYSELAKSIVGGIVNLPANFFSKFINIQKITVNEVCCSNELIRFLKKCHNLSYLTLKNAGIEDEYFYNQISDCPFLSFLILIEDEKILNCKFINKIRTLIMFETNQNLSIDFVLKLFEEEKNFKKITFKNDGELIAIRRYFEEFYEVTWKDKIPDNLKFGQINNHLFKLKKKNFVKTRFRSKREKFQ